MENSGVCACEFEVFLVVSGGVHAVLKLISS